MIEGLRGWLLSVTAAAILCALADSLMPKGPVKRVGGLVCALVLLAAVIRPVVRLEVGGASEWLQSRLEQTDGQAHQLEGQVDEQLKIIIQREYEAYIVDKAAQLGAVCQVRVECAPGEEGLYFPRQVTVRGTLTQSQRQELAQCIQTELGVPPAGQTYTEEEEST